MELRPAFDLPFGVFAVPPRRIDVGRLTMNAVVAGSGRPIVFIHGLGWDCTLWTPQIRRLSARYTVIAADTRGHGGTDKPPGPYSIPQFAEDWAALIERVCAEPTLIVGFSLGGMIAQRIAVTWPELVGALILAGTTCRIPSNSRQHMDSRLAAMRDQGPVAAAQVAAKSVYSEGWRARNPDILAAFVNWRAAQNQTALMDAMLATTEFDVTGALPKVSVPTLVITGAADTLIQPEAQAEIAKHIPGAQHKLIADAGHMASVEATEAFDRIVDGFLAHHWPPSAR